MKIQCSKESTKKWLQHKIPILEWMPKYKGADAIPDVVAGVTVGLTLIPQAIAYAALAGLEPQYGLYSGFAGCFIYVFFGSIKQVSIGPTAVVSLLTYHYTHNYNNDFAALLCFLSGVVELFSGLLRFGCLVDFVSVPVTAGFSSAAAIIIMTSQIKGILGLRFKTDSFVETWATIFLNLQNIDIWDLTLGITCCAVLLAMRRLQNVKVEPSSLKKLHPVLNNGLWLLSISRNAIVVIFCAILAFILYTYELEPFDLTGTIQTGFPKLDLPPFSTSVKNQTYTFFDMCRELGGGILVVPLISLLNNVAIAKAFAAEDLFDANQEMIALGLCNIIASFFGSMPVSGSFSRSAVNNASGVRSPLGGLYTACLVILSIGFLVPYFFYIPRATLSSIIVCAVIFMIEYRVIIHLWRASKKDLIPAFATFLTCLLQGVETGILIGVTIDLIYLLYVNARPRCKSETVMLQDNPGYVLFRPKLGILFANANYIRTKMKDTVGGNLPLVIDCSHVSVLDYTAIQSLKGVILESAKKNIKIIFYKLDDDLARVLSKVFGPTFVHVSSDLSEISKEFLDGLNAVPEAETSMDIEIQNLAIKESDKSKN